MYVSILKYVYIYALVFYSPSEYSKAEWEESVYVCVCVCGHVHMFQNMIYIRGYQNAACEQNPIWLVSQEEWFLHF